MTPRLISLLTLVFTGCAAQAAAGPPPDTASAARETHVSSNALPERTAVATVRSDAEPRGELAGGAVTVAAADLMAAAQEEAGPGAAEGEMRGRGGGGSADGPVGGLQQHGGGAHSGRRPAPHEVRGQVSLGALLDESGSGVFDTNAVTRMLQARVRAIQHCYERELRTSPTLAGRVVVQFSVTVEGRAAQISAAENTTGSDEVAACVTRVVNRFRFRPGAEGGSVRYRYPLVFARVN